MVPPFSDLDYWRWSQPCWLLLTGNPVLLARSQIPPGLIHRDHLLPSMKIGLKYIPTRIVMIQCSDYWARRRDRSPRGDALRRVRIIF